MFESSVTLITDGAAGRGTSASVRPAALPRSVPYASNFLPGALLETLAKYFLGQLIHRLALGLGFRPEFGNQILW